MEILIWWARNERKVSLEKLSVLTGISKSALEYYESGKRYPRIDQLEKIAKALETNINNLYNSRYK